METLERWLKAWSLVITLLLAALLCWAFSANGIVSEDAMPLGDSEHYVLRGMTLYGYLHTGQWVRFWDVFTLPRQSLAPLHYWLFFLLPQSWASMTSYGAIQAVATYGLLAFSTWNLCRALDRGAWAPALFLFCAAQNISLDYSYFYFADIPFMALGILALAWQIRAWRALDFRSGLLSGFGAGLMFWVKAPNAIIFSGTYVLAEVIWFGLQWRKRNAVARASLGKNTLRHAGAIATGYFPVTLAALACGGFQSIIQMIDANEVSGFFATTVNSTGLVRFLYFPLCLTFFYHTAMLLIILALACVFSFRLRTGEKNSMAPIPASAPFPASLLWPLIGAYFILGEFFSFGMENKEMRSLLPLLPVLWLAIFWALEHGRVGFGLTFLAAAVYVLGGLSQVFFNGFATISVNSEGYQLKDDWLFRLPQPHPASLAEIELTNSLLQLIGHALPTGGKIAIGTEQLYVTSESLIWCQQHEVALRGEAVPYEFNNFLANRGQLSRSGLLHARGILVIVHPTFQYTKPVYDATVAILKFMQESWLRDGRAAVYALQSNGMGTLGYLFVLKEPLTDGQIDELLAGTNAPELPPSTAFNAPLGHRLSWAESADILGRWVQKRLGQKQSLKN